MVPLSQQMSLSIFLYSVSASQVMGSPKNCLRVTRARRSGPRPARRSRRRTGGGTRISWRGRTQTGGPRLRGRACFWLWRVDEGELKAKQICGTYSLLGTRVRDLGAVALGSGLGSGADGDGDGAGSGGGSGDPPAPHPCSVFPFPQKVKVKLNQRSAARFDYRKCFKSHCSVSERCDVVAGMHEMFSFGPDSVKLNFMGALDFFTVKKCQKLHRKNGKAKRIMKNVAVLNSSRADVFKFEEMTGD